MGAPNRILGVDVLRGFCALAVMCYHYSLWGGGDAAPLAEAFLKKVGIYGVEAFFVISGFSLYVASERRDFRDGSEVRAFFIRRAFRILPLLFVASLASAAVAHINGAPYGFLHLAANATVLPLVIDPSLSVAVGGWSLGVEWGFYLAFPLLMLCGTRSFLTLTVASIMVLCLYAFALFDPALSLSDQNRLYVSIPNHAAFFLAGMALAKWRDRLPSLTLPWFAAGTALLLAALVMISSTVSDQAEIVTGFSRLALFAVSAGLVLVFAQWQLGEARSLTWFGDISFALYLVHPLAFNAAGLTGLEGWGRMAAGALITLTAATASYYWFERPATRLSHRFTRRPAYSAL